MSTKLSPTCAQTGLLHGFPEFKLPSSKLRAKHQNHN